MFWGGPPYERVVEDGGVFETPSVIIFIHAVLFFNVHVWFVQKYDSIIILEIRS